MKYIGALLLFCSINGVFGQQYLDLTSQWYEVNHDFHDGYIQLVNHQLVSDTLINGNVYYNVLTTSDMAYFEPWVEDTLSEYQSRTRTWLLGERNGAFFERVKDDERKIADFNLTIGDIIFNTSLVVTDIEYVEIGGALRKKFLTANPEDYVLEGVGSSNGLMYYPGLLGDELYTTLKCYRQGDLSIDLTENLPENISKFAKAGNDCYYLDDITSISHAKEEGIRIFPNPVTNFLTIDLPQASQRIAVYNSLGKLVKMFDAADQGSLQMDVSSLDRGLYFINIEGHSLRFIKI